MRFSNLTNRGIIATGPYRFVRHPAYIGKNLFWLLAALPFLPRHELWGQRTMWWVCGAILYGIRAYTEERHLAQDPKYREYQEKVRWKFIPYIW